MNKEKWEDLQIFNPKLAQLREAAPELYEALKEIHLVWEGLDPERRFPHLEEVIIKALAKAKGK